MRETRVVFPLPVVPMTPTISPLFISRLMFLSTLEPSLYPKSTFSKEMEPSGTTFSPSSFSSIDDFDDKTSATLSILGFVMVYITTIIPVIIREDRI